MNYEDIVKYYVDKGYSPIHAAAIAGNLQQESSLDPTIINKDSGAFGLAQWLGPRKEALQDFAMKQGTAPVDPYIQLDFIDHELKNSEKKAGDKFFASNDLNEATSIFSDSYERAGKDEKANDKRVGYAEQALNLVVPTASADEFDLSQYEEVAPEEAQADLTHDQPAQPSIDMSQYEEVDPEEVDKDLNRAKLPFIQGLGNELLKNYSNTIGMFGSDVNPIAKAAKAAGIPIPADIASNAVKSLTSEGESPSGKFAADLVTSLPMMFMGPAGVSNIPGLKPWFVNSLKNRGYDMLMGGAQSFATEDGDAEKRGEQGAISALLSGVAGTAGQFARGAFKGGKYAWDRFVNPEDYTSKKAASIIQDFVHNPNQAVSNIDNAKQYVKDYKPTAAELADDTGLNALQKHVEAIDPGKYGKRNLEQMTANERQVRTVSGTDKGIAAQEAKINAAVKPLYDAAVAKDITVTPGFAKLMKRPNMVKSYNKTVETLRNGGKDVSPTLLSDIQRGYRKVDTGLFDKNGKPIFRKEPVQVTGEMLDVLKKSLDELPTTSETAMGKTERINHRKAVEVFERWRAAAIPEYKVAQDYTKALKKPLNIKKTAMAVKNKGYEPLNDYTNGIISESESGFASGLKNIDDLAIEATGRKVQLSPQQLKTLNNVASNMARKAKSNVGSGGNFARENEGMAARIAGGIVSPVAPGAYQAASAAMIDLFNRSSQAVKQKISDVLLDPELTKKFLLMSDKEKYTFLNNDVANRIPGVLGNAISNQRSR